jgi:magnesium-protoporphyrin O-methyltransferase
MNTMSYEIRRRQIEHYFDRTAVDAWKRLTSNAPVGRIRATVRAGRDDMRARMLSWLPADLSHRRILDAGCGTGAFAIEAARRGADVVAIDLSPALVEMAQNRATELLHPPGHAPAKGRVHFMVGDMLDRELGRFDHVVAMDSLIHYAPADTVRMLAQLAGRTRESIVFTFAPRTPALTMMHAVGRVFPRSDRAPAIEPVDAGVLRRHLAAEPALHGWHANRTSRVTSGFYISEAMELAAR